MLKKLLKYDLSNIFKVLIIFYSLALVFAVLTRILFSFENSLLMNIIARISSGVTISMIFNILVNNLLRLWVRFKTNLYGDESYLTHTLPVSKGAHYASKALCAVISLFTSILVCAVTLFAAYYKKGALESIKNLLLPATSFFDVSAIAIIAILLFVLFLQFSNILQCGFTGLILGHRANNSKVGISVLFGFITYMISQTLIILAVLITSIFNRELLDILITQSAPSPQAIKQLILISAILYSCLLAVLYLINTRLLKKGVNVD